MSTLRTMSLKPRRAIATVAITALALSLGACGGGDTPAADGSLALYTWMGAENEAQWKEFVAEAKKQQPDMKIELEGPSYDDYYTKVKTRLSGDNPPCLITTQSTRTAELGSILQPLDELAEKSNVDLSGYNKSMLEGMTVDGTIRALPYDAEPYVLFYNVEMFEAAGITLPTSEFTRDDFLAAAKALTTDEHDGLVIHPGIGNAVANTIAGGSAWVDGELNLDDPKLAEELQWHFDQVSVEGISKAPDPATQGEEYHQKFINGEAAMLVEGPWMYGTFDSGSDFTLGVSVVPTPSGKASAMTLGSGFGISTTCEQPEKAFEAIVALTSPETQRALSTSRGIVPAHAEALDAWADGRSPESFEAIKASLVDATPQLTTPTWNQVETLWGQYAIEGFRGERTAAEILELIDSSIVGG